MGQVSRYAYGVDLVKSREVFDAERKAREQPMQSIGSITRALLEGTAQPVSGLGQVLRQGLAEKERDRELVPCQ